MDFRGLFFAVMALLLAFAGGAVMGWQWRGNDFDRQAQALTEQIERREAQRRAALEQELATARSRVTIAERAATEADAQRSQHIDEIARSQIDELDRVNAIIGEIGR
jgi:hypothetical protein